MKKEQKNKTIFRLYKIASADISSLYDSWLKNTPPRYDRSETGFESWSLDVDKLSSGSLSEQDKLDIINNKLDPNIFRKLKDWSGLIEVSPVGRDLKNSWKIKGKGSDYDDFVKFIEEKNITNLSSLNSLLSSLNSAVSAGKKERAIKPESEKPEVEAEREKEVGVLDRFKSFFDKDKNETDSKSDQMESFRSYSSDDDTYREILKGIGAPVTNNNMTLLYAWRQAEGGKATNNPFNTTWNAKDATNYNYAKVKNYKTKEDGINYTVKTLLLSYYNKIVSLLRKDADPMEVAVAIEESPWGTKHISAVLDRYKKGSDPRPPSIPTA